MGSPLFTADEYGRALQSLLPRGRVWPRDPDATQTKVCRALARIYERSDADAQGLLVDAFPATAYQLLPEWEQTCGLPDPCAGAAINLQSRRAQVVARLTASGGQSVPYMVQYAANLGYTISITEFSPARVGQTRVGSPLNGPAWASAMRVNAQSLVATSPLSIFRFRVGSSVVGEPLVWWGGYQAAVPNPVLECEIREICPAHVTMFFSYS